MKNMSFTQFAKTYGIGKKTLYNLTHLDDPTDFISKDARGHWQIDADNPAAMELVHGYTTTADRKAKIKEARDEKQIQATRLARIKADQEELKLGALSGKYIDVEMMRYYFSFFQRGINDSFAGIKKVSREVGRLYKANSAKEAEKVLMTELHICFSNAIRLLEAEIEKDSED